MRKKENLWTLDQAAALAALAETYGAPCRTLAQNFLGDAYEAETCFQDACRQVWQAGQGQGDLLSPAPGHRRLGLAAGPGGGAARRPDPGAGPGPAPPGGPALPAGEGRRVGGLLPGGCCRRAGGSSCGGTSLGTASAPRRGRPPERGGRPRPAQPPPPAAGPAPGGGRRPAPGQGRPSSPPWEGVEDPWLREAAGVRTQSRRRWLPALIGGGCRGGPDRSHPALRPLGHPPPPRVWQGEPGVLQDGAYYVYVGSGFALPNQNRTPEGIFRYIPGQGAEELVSCENYDINILADLGWRVNSHGLYFIDSNTGQLYRQDLATGEQTVLFTIPEEDLNPRRSSGREGPVELLRP